MENINYYSTIIKEKGKINNYKNIYIDIQNKRIFENISNEMNNNKEIEDSIAICGKCSGINYKGFELLRILNIKEWFNHCEKIHNKDMTQSIICFIYKKDEFIEILASQSEDILYLISFIELDEKDVKDYLDHYS